MNKQEALQIIDSIIAQPSLSSVMTSNAVKLREWVSRLEEVGEVLGNLRDAENRMGDTFHLVLTTAGDGYIYDPSGFGATVESFADEDLNSVIESLGAGPSDHAPPINAIRADEEVPLKDGSTVRIRREKHYDRFIGIVEIEGNAGMVVRWNKHGEVLTNDGFVHSSGSSRDIDWAEWRRMNGFT